MISTFSFAYRSIVPVTCVPWLGCADGLYQSKSQPNPNSAPHLRRCNCSFFYSCMCLNAHGLRRQCCCRFCLPDLGGEGGIIIVAIFVIFVVVTFTASSPLCKSNQGIKRIIRRTLRLTLGSNFGLNLGSNLVRTNHNCAMASNLFQTRIHFRLYDYNRFYCCYYCNVPLDVVRHYRDYCHRRCFAQHVLFVYRSTSHVYCYSSFVHVGNSTFCFSLYVIFFPNAFLFFFRFATVILPSLPHLMVLVSNAFLEDETFGMVPSFTLHTYHPDKRSRYAIDKIYVPSYLLDLFQMMTSNRRYYRCQYCHDTQ